MKVTFGNSTKPTSNVTMTTVQEGKVPGTQHVTTLNPSVSSNLKIGLLCLRKNLHGHYFQK